MYSVPGFELQFVGYYYIPKCLLEIFTSRQKVAHKHHSSQASQLPSTSAHKRPLGISALGNRESVAPLVSVQICSREKWELGLHLEQRQRSGKLHRGETQFYWLVICGCVLLYYHKPLIKQLINNGYPRLLIFVAMASAFWDFNNSSNKYSEMFTSIYSFWIPGIDLPVLKKCL